MRSSACKYSTASACRNERKLTTQPMPPAPSTKKSHGPEQFADTRQYRLSFISFRGKQLFELET